jgi:hypothetical protein
MIQKEGTTTITELEQEEFHITCVMHNTRTSQRMIEYNVKKGKPEYLSIDEETKLIEIICQIINEEKLNILALNLCADHLHFAIVCNPENLTKIVGKLKSKSARTFNIWRGVTTPTMGHAQPTENISTIKTRGKTQHSLWAQKFHRVEIKTTAQLHNVIEYITNNRIKHQLPPLKPETINLINSIIISRDDAFIL